MNNEKLLAELLEAGLSTKYADDREKRDPRIKEYIKVWVRDRYCCVYCGENLLQDRIRMTSAQIDHLLPKVDHEVLNDNPDNWVLACYCCNQIKRIFNPLKSMSSDVQNEIKTNPARIETHRDALIKKCRDEIKQYIDKKNEILIKVQNIIQK